jgi:hypothetical protein
MKGILMGWPWPTPILEWLRHCKCIVDSQSAFLPGRTILDNALVSIELVNYMKTKKRGNEKSFALKLDISKVYDMIAGVLPPS